MEFQITSTKHKAEPTIQQYTYVHRLYKYNISIPSQPSIIEKSAIIFSTALQPKKFDFSLNATYHKKEGIG
jgi:hypothetical protein